MRRVTANLISPKSAVNRKPNNFSGMNRFPKNCEHLILSKFINLGNRAVTSPPNTNVPGSRVSGGAHQR
jgi:hypothetical protein